MRPWICLAPRPCWCLASRLLCVPPHRRQNPQRSELATERLLRLRRCAAVGSPASSSAAAATAGAPGGPGAWRDDERAARMAREHGEVGTNAGELEAALIEANGVGMRDARGVLETARDSERSYSARLDGDGEVLDACRARPYGSAAERGRERTRRRRQQLGVRAAAHGGG